MVQGDGRADSTDCHGGGDSAGSEQSMSTSKSLASSMQMVEVRVSCSDFARTGDRKGFLSSPSSSEVSTGVKAGVSKGCGTPRGDWENGLMCLLVGAVRKGKARGLYKGLSAW